jgi:hypothetical protein
MSDTYRSSSSEQQWSTSNPNGQQNAFGRPFDEDEHENDVGKALLVGVLGGLLSAAGYLVYRRLPDEHRDRINAQVRTMIAQRITELRDNFNL